MGTASIVFSDEVLFLEQDACKLPEVKGEGGAENCTQHSKKEERELPWGRVHGYG